MKEVTSKKAIKVRRESAGDIRNFFEKGREDRKSSYRAGPQDTGKEGSGGGLKAGCCQVKLVHQTGLLLLEGRIPKPLRPDDKRSLESETHPDNG